MKLKFNINFLVLVPSFVWIGLYELLLVLFVFCVCVAPNMTVEIIVMVTPCQMSQGNFVLYCIHLNFLH